VGVWDRYIGPLQKMGLREKKIKKTRVPKRGLINLSLGEGKTDSDLHCIRERGDLGSEPLESHNQNWGEKSSASGRQIVIYRGQEKKRSAETRMTCSLLFIMRRGICGGTRVSWGLGKKGNFDTGGEKKTPEAWGEDQTKRSLVLGSPA